MALDIGRLDLGLVLKRKISLSDTDLWFGYLAGNCVEIVFIPKDLDVRIYVFGRQKLGAKMCGYIFDISVFCVDCIVFVISVFPVFTVLVYRVVNAFGSRVCSRRRRSRRGWAPSSSRVCWINAQPKIFVEWQCISQKNAFERDPPHFPS